VLNSIELFRGVRMKNINSSNIRIWTLIPSSESHTVRQKVHLSISHENDSKPDLPFSGYSSIFVEKELTMYYGWLYLTNSCCSFPLDKQVVIPFIII